MDTNDITPHPDWQLIEALGGASEVARLLGYPEKGGVQRVHNWKARGIPAEVKLRWPELFLTELIERVKATDDVQNNPGGRVGGSNDTAKLSPAAA